MLWRDDKQLDKAETELRRAVQILTAKTNAEAPATVEASIDLADVLQQRGQAEAARAILDKVAPVVNAKFVDDQQKFVYYAGFQLLR